MLSKCQSSLVAKRWSCHCWLSTLQRCIHQALLVQLYDMCREAKTCQWWCQ